MCYDADGNNYASFFELNFFVIIIVVIKIFTS
jgi:hypothetical protein